jgi:hypothetical protein
MGRRAAKAAAALLPALLLALHDGGGAAAKQLSWSLPVAEDEPTPPTSAHEPPPPPPFHRPPPSPVPARPRSSRKKHRQQRWLQLAERGMRLFQEGDMRGCVSQLQVRTSATGTRRSPTVLSIAVVAAGGRKLPRWVARQPALEFSTT